MVLAGRGGRAWRGGLPDEAEAEAGELGDDDDGDDNDNDETAAVGGGAE